MPQYLFFRIRKDGHLAGLHADHEAQDDLAAINQAHTIQDRLDIEIWQGPRVVAYVVADKDSTTG